MKKSEQSNIALYRKYRPENFTDVLGQEHIVKAIKGALDAGKVAHAYLLCGPRGTGKTTIARIIARELGTSTNDVYELDGASNRKIEDVREIRENIRTLPFDSKYKVYILDEVHMFTKEAWNALLKTLEEPPEHVIFILATTEMEKIPETIVSRCQSFTFHKPSDAVLAEVVKNTSKKEGYTLEDGGAELLALVGDGSFRDTLSNLDKVLSFAKDKNVSVADIASVTGAPARDLVEGFLLAIAEGNTEKGFDCVEKASMQNVDMKVYIKMILALLRVALVLRYAPNFKLANTNEHDTGFAQRLISDKPEAISSRTLGVLLEAYQKLPYAFIASIPLELALVEITDKA